MNLIELGWHGWLAALSMKCTLHDVLLQRLISSRMKIHTNEPMRVYHCRACMLPARLVKAGPPCEASEDYHAQHRLAFTAASQHGRPSAKQTAVHRVMES